MPKCWDGTLPSPKFQCLHTHAENNTFVTAQGTLCHQSSRCKEMKTNLLSSAQLSSAQVEWGSKYNFEMIHFGALTCKSVKAFQSCGYLFQGGARSALYCQWPMSLKNDSQNFMLLV